MNIFGQLEDDFEAARYVNFNYDMYVTDKTVSFRVPEHRILLARRQRSLACTACHN